MKDRYSGTPVKNGKVCYRADGKAATPKESPGSKRTGAVSVPEGEYANTHGTKSPVK